MLTLLLRELVVGGLEVDVFKLLVVMLLLLSDSGKIVSDRFDQISGLKFGVLFILQVLDDVVVLIIAEDNRIVGDSLLVLVNLFLLVVHRISGLSSEDLSSCLLQVSVRPDEEVGPGTHDSSLLINQSKSLFLSDVSSFEVSIEVDELDNTLIFLVFDEFLVKLNLRLIEVENLLAHEGRVDSLQLGAEGGEILEDKLHIDRADVSVVPQKSDEETDHVDNRNLTVVLQVIVDAL